MPSYSFHSRSAVTLLEVTICLLIISVVVLASLGPFKYLEKSQISSVAATARLINQLAVFIHSTTGQWPADVNNSILPPEMQPYLGNNIFQNETPIGGRWDWNGPSNSVSSSIGIAIRFNPDTKANMQLLKQLDQLMDDGDLSTGLCKGKIKSGSYFFIFETAQF